MIAPGGTGMRLATTQLADLAPTEVSRLNTTEPTTTNPDLAQLRAENAALRRENAEYRRLASVDPLTGLGNRRYLDERLTEEVDRARRELTSAFGLLLVDLDDFKAINDRQGHAAGDDALRWVATFLASNTRDHDVCFRTGGDEFVVLLPGADRAGAALMATRLRARLTRACAGRAVPVGMSLGVASWPEDGAGAERLLSVADERMYCDKAARKPAGAASRGGSVRDRRATLPWRGR